MQSFTLFVFVTAINGQPMNLTKASRRRIHLINQTLVTMSQKRKLEVLLDKQIEKKLQELEYWQKQRQKLVKNRNIKRKLEKRLTQKLAKEEELTQMITNPNRMNNTSLNTSLIASSNQSTCSCEKSKTKSTNKKRKKKKKSKGFQMNCFTMTKEHWKNPPHWTGN